MRDKIELEEANHCGEKSSEKSRCALKSNRGMRFFFFVSSHIVSSLPKIQPSPWSQDSTGSSKSGVEENLEENVEQNRVHSHN